MKSSIRTRIDRVREAYPEERLAASRRRIFDVWERNLPADRLPFTYMPCVLNYYDVLYKPADRLDLALDEFLNRAFLDDDFIPTLFPGCRQETIPSLFGVDNQENMRIIRDESDIENLPEPEIRPGSAAFEMLEMQRYLLQETEGAFPVNVMDMQGPVEVAAKMWGYEDFFITAYTKPKLCHALMAKLTRAFIMLWEAQRELLGELLVPTHLWGWNWAPPGIGASLSSDGLVMVSGEFCREFYNPSTEVISRYFGGVTVHSCGDFAATVPATLVVEGIRAIHAGQMSLAQLYAAGIRDQVTTIAFTPDTEFAAAMRLARREKLPCFLSVLDFWPAKPFSAWSEAEREECRKRHRDRLRVATGVV